MGVTSTNRSCGGLAERQGVDGRWSPPPQYGQLRTDTPRKSAAKPLGSDCLPSASLLDLTPVPLHPNIRPMIMRALEFRVVMLLTLSISAGCSMETTFTRTGGGMYPAKPANCSVEQYMMGSAPSRQFEVIGTLATHDPGLATGCSREESLKVLSAKACEVGADALIDIRKASQASSCDLLEASAIRWK